MVTGIVGITCWW